jgi:hypothetical protein
VRRRNLAVLGLCNTGMSPAPSADPAGRPTGWQPFADRWRNRARGCTHTGHCRPDRSRPLHNCPWHKPRSCSRLAHMLRNSARSSRSLLRRNYYNPGDVPNRGIIHIRCRPTGSAQPTAQKTCSAWCLDSFRCDGASQPAAWAGKSTRASPLDPVPAYALPGSRHPLVRSIGLKFGRIQQIGTSAITGTESSE